MGQPAPIPRRSSHLGSAACYGRSDHGSHSSTSAASSRSKRRQGNHNQFQTLKMFPDGHLHMSQEKDATTGIKAPEAEFAERVERTALEIMEQSGLFIPFTDADGSVRYRKTQKFNRLYLHKR